MHPLAVLTGIVLGSAVSITIALTLTLVVFLMLPEYASRIGEEFPPLLRALGGSTLLALLAAAAFLGEVKQRPWRRAAQATLWGVLAVGAWWIWPRD